MTDTDFGGNPDESRLVDRRIRLAREWEELVEKVRDLGPDFADFLRPLPLEKLLPAAHDGPVAIINVSRMRCDALLITAGEVQVCELPGLSAERLEQRVGEYLEILRKVDLRRAEFAGSADAVAREALDEAELHAESALRVILRWLWETIAEPVLTKLGFDRTPADGEVWPRLWWCPTGLLTLLPLHAAGDHEAGGPNRPTVLDRVVSSYTPTLRVLVEARKPLPVDGPPENLVLVTVAEAPDAPTLRMVDETRDRLSGRFGAGCTELSGPEATRERVREALARYRWVHLTCHGIQNLDDPSQGGLWLADGLLTIAEIGAGDHQAEFVFLMACKTATGGVALADEAITLAAALHYTGFRHVIGTLWTVYEGAALRMATEIYGDDPDLPFEPGRSASLLHRAQREMRESERLTTWSPFIHIGP
ncbi:CHAT domain-containing protein [Herbidospora sp. RD11066]